MMKIALCFSFDQDLVENSDVMEMTLKVYLTNSLVLQKKSNCPMNCANQIEKGICFCIFSWTKNAAEIFVNAMLSIYDSI